MKRALLLLLGAALLPAQGKKSVRISDVFTRPVRTTPTLTPVAWLDEDHLLYRPGDPAARRRSPLWVNDVVADQCRPVFDRETLRRVAATLPSPPRGFDPTRSYTWSPERTRLLYRRGEDLIVLDLEQEKAWWVRHTQREKRHVTFSPRGRYVAYTAGHDLYVLDLDRKQERRLTRDGSETIRNGVHSWVYFEEFYHRNYRAFWWSPNGRFLAFARYDDRPVMRLTLVDEVPADLRYGPFGFREEVQHYPKAGTQNPLVRLGVADVRSGRITWLETGHGVDDYLAHVTWTPDGEAVAVQKLNRRQNRLTLLLCDPVQGTVRSILTEESDTWLDVREDYRFLKVGILWPSARTGYRHLYLYSRTGKLLRTLTAGAWSVKRIVAVDEAEKRVFFLANEGSTLEQHLFVVGLDGLGRRRLTKERGTHTALVSPKGERFVDTWSDLDTPPRVVLRGGPEHELDRARLRGADRYRLVYPERITYRTRDGLTLPGLLWKPPGFQKGKRYPLLVSIYGGPASQGVRNAWRLSLLDQALCQAGLLLVKLDHRGAGHLGKKGVAAMYRRLGHFEIRDYADAVRNLTRRGLVDPDRVGIWGWSYGGYTTLMALLTAPDVFKVGVAVAPVTDWRCYDTIYTERYMDLPASNPEGYRAASALTHARNLKGRLLLIHGTMDDNVHFQNAILLIREFVRLGKPFDLMIYPQARHSIQANRARPHLFRKLYRFLVAHLLGGRRL